MVRIFVATLFFLIRFACAECEEEACMMDDTALLQPRLGRILEKEAETQDTCQPLDYNNGDCVGKNTCFECDFTGKKILPANKDRFPTGFLQCQGDSTTCNTADAGATIKFRSSLDYLYCKGAGTCSDTWNVENAGAACCAYRGSCQGSKISLTPASDPDGGCQNDMCCDGIDSCSEGELKGIESLTCRGNRACSSATVEVSRDLLCDGDSIVNQNPSGPRGSCKQSSFTLSGSDGYHVVDCLGQTSCVDSSFEFASNSRISFACTSSTNDGRACRNAEITLQGGSCIDLDCSVNNVGGSDCEGLTLTKEGSDSCYYQGPEDYRPDDCTEANTTRCGDVPRDPVCCQPDLLDPTEPDSCADCCAPVTTTAPDITTTTTTTTSKKKPYSDFRRNRRTERRNSRQHRRQSRQYKYS
ncbi:unnamed protein product [Durusdinium trenchii]|uniref:Disintegrin domain-containing protein n=1 Tax=Durusdinium trenchii TaxID=1381693 RepID=A0ABP0KYU2_9DINO